MVIPREPKGLRRDYTQTPQISKAYLLGILHDTTVRKTTYRLATKNKDFAEIIKSAINILSRKAWVYREGNNRNLWIVEFSRSLLNGAEIKSKQEKVDYIRGFFDAEGGIAKAPRIRFYLYFCQKNKGSLVEVKKYLSELGIECGAIHNPSRKVDPDYWRFFIRAASYKDFARKISSNHPEKFAILRMKI